MVKRDFRISELWLNEAHRISQNYSCKRHLPASSPHLQNSLLAHSSVVHMAHTKSKAEPEVKLEPAPGLDILVKILKVGATASLLL